jgi:NAD(P)-dependent dehydrogenase (short-subunit alcohol dehydrogenase family)
VIKTMRLEDQVAIVTGGASGQGRAISKLFAKEGARVTVADIDEEGIQETINQASDIEGVSKHDLVGMPTDVSSEEEVKQLTERTVDEFDKVNILVNSAGTLAPPDKKAHELSVDEWNRTLDVNLSGPWLCTKHAVPYMKKVGGGKVVNVASTAGMRPFPGASPYCISKAGLLMLTKTSALEYVDDDIRVTAVVPGHIDTAMMDQVIEDMEESGVEDAEEQVRTGSNPMGRLGTPKEVAKITLFLASDASSFVTGSFVLADGGYMAG